MKGLTKRISKKAAIGAAVIGGMPLAIALSALLTEYKPKNIESLSIFRSEGRPALNMGQEIDLLSWNLQYCAGRRLNFFYDGGDSVHADSEDVIKTMDDMVDVINKVNPDIALIQEIDRNAKRTQYIDQLRHFVDGIDRLNWTAAPYHRSPFVPSPINNPLGRVDLNLALFSKFRMTQAHRRQLPLLKESRIRQIFNLKRAIVDAEIPIKGHNMPLVVGVTHLSAFSYGDGTLSGQIEALDKWMSTKPANQPWILAGDFNLLPPGDSPKRLGESAKLYAEKDNPLSTIIPKYKTAFQNQLAPENRTYLPFGAEKPDRKIDYIFYGGPIKLVDSKVLLEQSPHSDHLPLWAKFKLGAMD